MKLSYKRTLLVGLAFLSICTFWQAYESIVPLILKEVFHIDDTWAGFVMALDNILALFLLPLFGTLSDRVRTPIGRRMPFILGGTIASSVFTFLLPIAAMAGSLPLFFGALGMVLLSMSTYRSPAVALMPDLTPAPLRSKANAVINLMGALGGVLALLLVALLVPKTDTPSYLPVFAGVAVIMLLSVGVLFLTVREPSSGTQPRPEESKKAAQPGVRLSTAERRSLILILLSVFFWFFGYNAVTTAFSKYARHYWGLEGGLFAYTLIVAQGAAIVAFIPVGALATRIGRRRTILGGIVLLSAAFGTAALFTSFSPVILLLFAFAGIAWAAINVNSFPMVLELCRGGDEGRYTGFYYTFSMAAQIITPIFSGFLLEHVGYHTLFPYGASFVALSFITMLLVRHGDTVPGRNAKHLTERSAAAEQ